MVVTLSVTAYVATILALIYYSTRKPLKHIKIRVVNAFRQGLDSRGSLADAALAEALRKQTALSKRFSHSSSIDYADTARDTLAPHDIDVERLSSHSHTETAV